MIQDALAEKRQDAAESFALALERERHHQEVFARALELLQQKQERLSEALSATLPTGEGIGELDLQTYTEAAMEVDRERFRVANLGRLREVVFGRTGWNSKHGGVGHFDSSSSG